MFITQPTKIRPRSRAFGTSNPAEGSFLEPRGTMRGLFVPAPPRARQTWCRYDFRFWPKAGIGIGRQGGRLIMMRSSIRRQILGIAVGLIILMVIVSAL